MIERKDIFLWVLENGEPVRKPLLEIDLTKKRKHSINYLTYNGYWPNNVNFKLIKFADDYVRIISILKKKFKKILEREYQLNPYCRRQLCLEDKLIETGINFTEGSAFKELTKEGFMKDEEDKEEIVDVYACFNEDIGIILLNPEARDKKEIHRYIYKDLRGDMIHEYGHCLDYLLNPIEYNQRTATMREIMAILTQEELKIKVTYTSPPHKRAEKLLRLLSYSDFSKFDFADKWIYLNKIVDHKEAFEYFVNDFSFKIPKNALIFQRSLLNSIPLL